MKYGKIFPMESYYEKRIKPINRKFGRRKSGKIICPFHEDATPSMGFIQNSDGSEVYHCFGCNAKGNVIKLHQEIERVYHNRTISREQATRELCDIFGYPYDKLKKGRKEEEEKKIKKVQTFNMVPKGELDIPRFKREFSRAKRDRRDIRYFNALLIQYIEESKDER